MADVRLHRAQPQRPVLGTVLSVGGQQGLRLDGIPETSTRAVCLDGVHLGGGQPGDGQGLPNNPLLRGAVGRGEPITGAVLVDRTAPHHRQHPVTKPLSIREPLHQQHTRTLTPARTVRTRPERLAPAIHRQPPLPRELHERQRRRHHRHTACQRHITLTRPQCLHGEMQRDQRRRARRVDSDSRALQTQGVGDPPGHHTRRVPCTEIPLSRLGGLQQQARVVLAVGAHEHTTPTTPQRRRIDPGILQRLPARLQQQPLLRIHRQRLTRRNTEEPRIKPSHIRQKRPMPRIRRPQTLRIRIEQPLQIPAPVHREPRHRIGPRHHQIPQLTRRTHPTRETARHTHDHHRIVGHRHRTRPERHQPSQTHNPRELTPQIRGKFIRRRIVEHQRRRRRQTGHSVHPIPELHRGKRVEAQILERTPGYDHLRRRVPQHQRSLLLHQCQQQRPLLSLRQRGHPRPQRRCARTLRRPLRTKRLDLRNLIEERAGGGGHRRQIAFPVHLHDREAALVARSDLPQNHQRPGRLHRLHAQPSHSPGHRLISSHPGIRPRAPRHTRPDQPAGPTLLDQRLQRGIRRRIVALPLTTPRTRHRRERHKQRQRLRQPSSQLIQMNRRINLRPPHCREPLRRQSLHHTVVQHPRRMHHTTQRELRRNPRQHPGQRHTIRHITRHHTRRTTQLRQLSEKFSRPRSLHTPPAHQQQTPHTLTRKPTRHLSTQPTSATCHQHRATSAPRTRRRRPGRCRSRHHPPHEHTSSTHRHLILRREPTRKNRNKPLHRSHVHDIRQVQQPTPAPRLLQTDRRVAGCEAASGRTNARRTQRDRGRDRKRQG